MIQSREAGEITKTFDIELGTDVDIYVLRPVIAADPYNYSWSIADASGNDFTSLAGVAWAAVLSADL